MAKVKKGYEELVWAVSALTELIGQAFVSSADERRSFHWADDDHCVEYFTTTPYIIFARTIVWAGQTQPKLQSSFFQHISSPSTGYCQIHLCYPPITSPSVLSTLSRSYLNI